MDIHSPVAHELPIAPQLTMRVTPAVEGSEDGSHGVNPVGKQDPPG